MKSKYIIGDVHGCLKTLKVLIAKLPTSAHIVLRGDLIDRGPDSPGVVEFVMENNYACVLGNHEHMLLDLHAQQKIYESGLWFYNGGTSEDLERYTQEMKQWIASRPPYLIFEDCIREDGRKLMVSHAGVMKGLTLEGAVAQISCRPQRMRDYPFERSILWNRSELEDIPGYFQVIGHTPTPKPEIKKHYANIDTGCAYKHRSEKLGRLTCLEFPSMRAIQQEFCG